jgi:UDP-4-amino-4,6-dideoxy-N-acetyl-beta-L-altrosamine transaminase
VHKQPFFPYGRQWIDQKDIDSVVETLKSDTITRGERVIAFEKALADYCGAKHVIAFNNGTSALHAAYYAAEVSSFDQVVTSPNTFVGTVTGAMLLGAKPRLIDIELSSGNMDISHLEPRVMPPSTRGRNIFVPVHFAGRPIDMQRLEACIPEAVVIEDACHALGATYTNGKRVGCCEWSNMTVFSFHPVKTITMGEGGAVLTNDDWLDIRLRHFRNNGMESDPRYMCEESPGPWYYEVQDFTGNYHLTAIQAALGLSQLQKIDGFVAKRRHLVAEYRKHLASVPHVQLLSAAEDDHSAHHLFVVLIDFEKINKTRADVILALREAGVGTQVHYIPLYRHPIFRNKFGIDEELFPQTEGYYSQALSLPLYYALEEKDIATICNTLQIVLKK